jgi:hypothetical protein
MNHDPTDISREQAQADKARRVAERENADFLAVMRTAEGRRLIWRLLERAGLFRSTFSENALLMAHAEGRRNEGLFLLDQINRLCPERYPVMAKEFHDG